MEFEDYVNAYSASLTRLCMALCGNKADAEDLFQETWLKAFRGFSRFDKASDFEKWLYTICANTFKNSLKSSWRRRRYDFRTDEELNSFFSAIPEVNDENRADFSSLHSAIMSLPRKQRLVIVLYYFKDYNIREISRLVKAPEGTVKSRLYQAKQNIRRRLSDE